MSFGAVGAATAGIDVENKLKAWKARLKSAAAAEEEEEEEEEQQEPPTAC